MKIRNGFVSNSSTTSFCIYGASIQMDSEDAYELCCEAGLECHNFNDGWSNENTCCVGISPWKMGDNETMGEFKKRVHDLIVKTLNMDVVCEPIEEAWRDG